MNGRADRPDPARWLAASGLAVLASLGADALLSAAGRAVFPGIEHYPHLQFGDYAKLTIPGVLAACAAWGLVGRLSPSPRRLYLRLAVLVTVVLLVPDAWILYSGQPPAGVLVLVLMHLAIAVITYNALVRLAPLPPT